MSDFDSPYQKFEDKCAVADNEYELWLDDLQKLNREEEEDGNLRTEERK
jgi:hypothetical protein